MELGSFGEKLLIAMGWAGKHGQRARLHGVTDDLLRRGYGGRALAKKLVEATDDDPALTNELLDEIGLREGLLERYGSRRAAKLRAHGEVIKLPSTDGDRAGQGHTDTPYPAARPAEQNGAGDGAGGGQNRADAQCTAAPATNTGAAGQDGSGQVAVDTQRCVARPSANNGPMSRSRRATALKARNEAAQGVLGTQSGAVGKPWGDCTKLDLENAVRRNTAEAQFARRALAEARFNDDDTTPLKRALGEDQAKKLWNAAWEAVTHAA